MRIGLIVSPWAPVPPPAYGAIETIAHDLATGFQAAGHEVLLCAVGTSTCPVPRMGLLDHPPELIGTTVPELRHVLTAYQAVRSCDVVHDHSILGPIYSERFTGMRVVTTVHGPFGDFTPIYEHVAEHATVIAVSHAQRRAVPHISGIRVIHHGLDATQYPLGTGSGGYCLFLGRMNHDKGAHRAIAAASKAGLPLLIAAKMRERHEVEYYEQHVQPHLNDQIRYLGEVGYERKLELLAGAGCLLFPVRWAEPFGLVMIEALACGTPVLAFPEGAVPEVIDDGRTGYLCQDETEMADAIGRVGRLDRMACRAAVEGHFSKDRMVAEHLELFEELL